MGKKKHIKREVPQGRLIKGHKEEDRNTDNENPIFSFHLIVDRYNIGRCEKDEKCNFIKTIIDLSKLKWIQIYSRPHDNGGVEKIPQNQLRFSFPHYITPDIDILSTRMNIKGRILGYRENATFHIIWIDKDHKAYKG